MPYFIKRDEKVNGPFTEAQIKSGVKSGKLKDSDLISNSKNGAWKTVQDAVSKSPQTPPVQNKQVTDVDVSSWLGQKMEKLDDSEIENVLNTPTAHSSGETSSESQLAENEIAAQSLPKEYEGDSSHEVPVSKSEPLTKICPFCAEEIKAAAIKCKHCGESLESESNDSPTEENAGLLIRTFDTRGELSELVNKPGFFGDEATCQLKFKRSGSYLLVAGPMLTREDGRQFFIDGEYDVNRVSGEKGEGFQANVDFAHRNWRNTSIEVMAVKTRDEIPICKRPQLSCRVEYIGLEKSLTASKPLFGFSLVKPFLTNGVDFQQSDNWVPLNGKTGFTWCPTEPNQGHVFIQPKVLCKNTGNALALQTPRVPYPTVVYLFCSDVKAEKFKISWEPDFDDPDIVLQNGEVRFRTLDVISGE